MCIIASFNPTILLFLYQLLLRTVLFIIVFPMIPWSHVLRDIEWQSGSHAVTPKATVMANVPRQTVTTDK